MTPSGIEERDIREFSKIAKELSDLNDRIRSYCPSAHVFMEQDALHLMVGECNRDGDYKDATSVSVTFIRSADCGADNGLSYDEAYDKYQFKGETRIAKQTKKAEAIEALNQKYKTYFAYAIKPMSFEDFSKYFGDE